MEYEVKEWTHDIFVSTQFAEQEPQWKEYIKTRLRSAVLEQTHAVDIELLALIDGRELPPFKYEGHWRLNMFKVYGVYKVTIPIPVIHRALNAGDDR